jgi:hypothetical protein
MFAVGITSGTLAAMAANIVLAHAGFSLSEEHTVSGTTLQFASVWWAIASVALVVSACIVAVMTRLPFPWKRFRLLRWVAGAIVVFVLADVGHMAGNASIGKIGVHVGLTIAALLSSALVSLLGCYLAAKR